MRDRWILPVASSLLLVAGCASVTSRSEPRAAEDQLLIVINNQSHVDLTVFLMQDNSSVRALGRVDRFDSRTFRIAKKSVSGRRVALRAFDESMHITPLQAVEIAEREARTVRALAGFASGPFPSELARRVDWQIGVTPAAGHLTLR
jgi:hypothetical protein